MSIQVEQKRYSPTRVTRSVLKNGRWEQIEEYDDATVQDIDRERRLGSAQVMLRAYSPDPTNESVYGNEEEQLGAGVHLNTSNHYGKEMKGYVLDCDGDIAVKRIVMNGVLAVDNQGHGAQTYTGIVSFEEIGAWGSGTREVKEWTGFGDLGQVRLEQWDVYLAGDA